MNSKTGIIALTVISLGLLIGLIIRNQKATEQETRDTATILHHSNQWQQTTVLLEEQKQVNLNLSNDVDARKKDLQNLTNKLTQTATTLVKTEASLKSTEASLRATEAEVKKRDARINELESANAELDKRAGDLSSAITNLNTQIANTERKLSAAEGDKAFLTRELNRLMAEKAELERQFTDLALLREQVRRLKEELSIERRLEWIRKGIWASGEMKGAQMLMQGTKPPPKPKQDFDLNVEVNSDGTVRRIPSATNAPVAPSAPR